MLVEVLLLLILISVWFGFYQIVKQQGRIILRMDVLEQRISAPQPDEPQGLEVGTDFPGFSFPDVEGTPVPLECFLGKRVLLVHWSPQCGFCDLIASDLAKLQPDFEKRNVQLLLLAHGDAEANRKLAEEHGLKCPILLYKDAKVPEPLANLGTPSAYLLDAEGRAGKPLAVGSEQVTALAEEAAKEEAPLVGESESKRAPGEKPISASRIVRDGLKAGTPAPTFSQPDIYGRIVSLDEYRGRRMLLVFSDPNCGPCDQVATELARFDRKHANNELAVIMVGRGDPEENRKKAEQHGIKFPVVMQEKWRLSKAYGIFTTPVAFLIDEGGVITKDVATGLEGIMALAQEGLKTQKETKHELSYR
jgi:peroxiredoxin